MDIKSLVTQISPPIDNSLATLLLTEFVDIERRFAIRDWEPATLNGGQFSEVASRVIYHLDSGNLNYRKGLNPCLKYIEDENNSNRHSFPNRQAALHLCRVLRTIYKFRSDRGAVHIDPNYTANELDSTLILSLSRWVMSEIFRLFWKGTQSEVARLIRGIVRYSVPSVFEIDGQAMVLRTDCTAEEEILLLLHNYGEIGLSRTEIVKSVKRSNSTISNVLRSLSSSAKRQIVKQDNGQYQLTPNGTKRIYEDVSEKLSLA